MSLQVIFDRILGRLREKDYDTGGGGTPSVPDPTSHFTYQITPNNKSYFADAEVCPGMTVTVTLKFDGQNVDPDAPPDGWQRQSKGVYSKSIDAPGTVGPQQWSYTPGGEYEDRVASLTTPARSLTAVYPAYWGIYPSDDAAGDISAIVAALKDQHRATDNVNTTVEIPNPTANSCWLWIVTRNNADAEPTATPGISMMDAPVTGKTFPSPMPGANWNLSGYKAYVSMHSAKAGASFGNVKLTINIAHTP